MVDIVCFNINYRKGPEAKTPKNFEDAVCGFKYFKEHAAEYGGDPNCLSIIGNSGGAWIAFGATLLLVREGLSD